MMNKDAQQQSSQPSSVLEQQIQRTLSPGMSIPEPLRLLFRWIEVNGYFLDFDEYRAGSLGAEQHGGTEILFRAYDPPNLWFSSRLRSFARTGADGSRAAFWIDAQNQQQIVHIGSGSGSLLTCVLVSNPVDFLRLLAIGYEEICWPEEFYQEPNWESDDQGKKSYPNEPFRNWVKTTFTVEIPPTAAEIVHSTAEADNENPADPFCLWFRHGGEQQKPTSAEMGQVDKNLTDVADLNP